MKAREEALREATELAVLAEWDPSARRRAFLSLCLWPALLVLLLVLAVLIFVAPGMVRP